MFLLQNKSEWLPFSCHPCTGFGLWNQEVCGFSCASGVNDGPLSPPIMAFPNGKKYYSSSAFAQLSGVLPRPRPAATPSWAANFIHISYTFDSQDVNDSNKRRRLKKEEKDIKRWKVAIKREQTKLA
ncbi:MAG: hypothetical protein J5548_10170 [Prevotella sp.]|nr:hypothetical protein [Prevotella sp.]